MSNSNRRIQDPEYKPTNKEYNRASGKIDFCPWETQIISRKPYKNWKLYRKKQYRPVNYYTKRRA